MNVGQTGGLDMVKIFLAEDEKIVREGIKMVFRGKNTDLSLQGKHRMGSWHIL